MEDQPGRAGEAGPSSIRRKAFMIKGSPASSSTTPANSLISREKSTLARKSTVSQDHASRDDIDHSLSHISFRSKGIRPSGKRTVPHPRNSDPGPTSHLHHSLAVPSPYGHGHNMQSQKKSFGAYFGVSPSDHHRSLPTRKTISVSHSSAMAASGRRLSMITPSKPEALPAKSSPPVPTWQQLDVQFVRGRGQKRQSPGQEERDVAKKVATAGSNRRITTKGFTDGLRTGAYEFGARVHRKSYLGRHMTLRYEGEKDEESDSSMEVDDRPPRRIVRKTVTYYKPFNTPVDNSNDSYFLSSHPQTGVKAARKREWPPEPLFDPESSDEYESSGPPSSDSQDDELEYIDADKMVQPRPVEKDPEDIEVETVTAVRRSFSPDDIKILPPPQGTIGLPLQTQESSATPSLLKEPNHEMWSAIEDLCLPLIRMQKTKQLPFLVRTVRRGFLLRCRALSVPIKPTPGPIAFKIHYMSTSSDGQKYIVETQLDSWVCPLCELHGPLPSRELLKCHLDWDHDETSTQWSLKDFDVWLLLITIPEVVRLATPAVNRRTMASNSPAEDVGTRSPTDRFSPFPFVALSPTSNSRRISTSIDLTQSPSREKTEEAPTILRAFPAVPSIRARSATAATTATTATTETTTTTTTATATARQTPRPTRPLTPPPRTNPLGPAAQPPYLPAKSEYGGPDVHYSCRPGGACLLDLLNTLPLEPYGVLAWDILDREDEIYDSDNVKDEYKVMHALWGRWIVLNRNEFIRDYYKGTVAFVDGYWKMIHRAAGWDALRYWLLMLVANRFITGSEVAQILKHYEHLTGMNDWYD